jgi:hypothetical protein
VEVVVSPEKRPIPRLRYLGVQAAGGDLIAILEDHAEVEAGWARALIDAHIGTPWGAVGGAVENGQLGWVNWSAFFCEYTPYMGPVCEGLSGDLPGNNVAYKREHLLKHAHVLDDGKWESWVNARLLAEGVPLLSTNRAVVRHIKQFELRSFLTQRFHFARSYAGMRRVDQTWVRRLVYGIGSAALPVLLLARVIRQAIPKRKPMGVFLRSLPLVAVFLLVGAIGEMVGYLWGPGRSLDLVE